MPFESALHTYFPGAVAEDLFVLHPSTVLMREHGFTAANTLGCIGLCRDERCRPLADRVSGVWGEAFSLGSLAGMLWLGRTGLAAARGHVPVAKGRRRMLFAVLPHLSFGPDGVPGDGPEPGAPGACGALLGLHDDLRDDPTVETRLDPADIEQSLLRRRLAEELGGRVPADLVDLTRAAHRASLEDLERLIDEGLDPATDDYAVLTGILVHVPGDSYVWPGPCYAVVGGRRHALRF